MPPDGVSAADFDLQILLSGNSLDGLFFGNWGGDFFLDLEIMK